MSKKKVNQVNSSTKMSPRVQKLLEQLVNEDSRLQSVHRRAVLASTKTQSSREDTTSMGEETRNIYRQHLKG